MRRVRTGAAIAGTVLVASLALAACGDDEGSEPASQTSATTATTESTGTTSTTSTTSTGTTSTTTETTTTGGGSGGLGPSGEAGSGTAARCAGAESPPNIVNVTSYGADCAAVEAAMAEIRTVRRSFRIGDFDCERATGSRYGGTWECRGEASYFSFDFGD